jgi:inner membrane protein
MPSPIGHSMMGYILYRLAAKPSLGYFSSGVAPYLLAANAPDLDFIPGLLVGDLGRYHHGPSHSIVAAFIFGLFSVIIVRRLSVFVGVSSAYLSHILLDYLVQDPSSPYGVPLFWPLTERYYMAPFAFYRPVNYPGSLNDDFIHIVFSLHNLITVFAEVFLLTPVLILVLLCKRHLFSASRSSAWLEPSYRHGSEDEG